MKKCKKQKSHTSCKLLNTSSDFHMEQTVVYHQITTPSVSGLSFSDNWCYFPKKVFYRPFSSLVFVFGLFFQKLLLPSLCSSFQSIFLNNSAFLSQNLFYTPFFNHYSLVFLGSIFLKRQGKGCYKHSLVTTVTNSYSP